MRGIHPRKRFVALAVLLALVGAVCLIVAAPQRKPMREQMALDDVPVTVDYKPVAKSNDLGLPFYGGAQVGDSFSYRVTSKEEGKPVTYYASAVLTSPDAAETVSRYYSNALPGKPKAELLDDKDGRRYVLAVGSDAEVRKVTIMPQAKGCRIELSRVFSPKMPPKPLKPGKGEHVT